MATYKQSTAYTRTFFLYLASDHITAATGKTPTVNLSKAGGAFAAAGGTVTEIGNGEYKIVLTTTDTNTLGDLAYYITATATDDCKFVDQITARGVDDLAYPATSGRSMVVDAAGLVDANVVKLGPSGSGTAQTARDVGASVLLSAGTGTGQLDFTSGVVKSNMVQILASALTETVGGYLTAAFKKLFDVAVPVFTSASVNQTGDSYARIGAAGAGLTALGDARLANLDATVSSRSTYAGADTAGTTTLLSRLGTPVGASISADVAGVPTALLDLASGVETGATLRQALRVILAATGGKMDGGGTATIHFRNVADTKNRITATCDASGNRTAITFDLT